MTPRYTTTEHTRLRRRTLELDTTESLHYIESLVDALRFHSLPSPTEFGNLDDLLTERIAEIETTCH